MRRALAILLHRLADFIYNDDFREAVVIVDEYGISRCHVDVRADDSHGVDGATAQLPVGWELTVTGEQQWT